MKKAFILLLSLVAIVAANLSAKAQEVTTAEASKGGDVVRPINIFNTDGNWNDGSNWNTGSVPAPGSYVEIRANAVIPGGYVAVADGINLDGGSITVADGGQLKHNTENLVVTMKKNIEPYSVVNGTDNYYLLSFPFSKNVAVPDTMTAVEGCDFYAFDGDFPNAEWRNNKNQTIDSVGGTTGYLYASPEAIELSLTGSTCTSYYDEIKTVTIPYTDGSSNLSNGWALLGNPFTCDAYIYYYDNYNRLVPMDFMVYDAEGELVTLSNRPIAPMQGFFVKVTEPTTVCILNYLFVPVASSYHEYVDFGLPSGTLWATCNVGAYWPEEYGDRFAWGETQPKDTYSWSNYQHCSNGGDHNLTKYCTNPIYGYQGFADYLITLLPEDDAVTMNWGEEWRMPTKAEMQELFDNTTHTWTTQNEVEGVLITDSNENSIFLPADNYDAFYWSSSLLASDPSYACEFTFDQGAAIGYFDEGNRAYGWPVRAVHCKNSFINVSTNSTVGGSVSGGGTFYDGTDCTISATANDGYTFIGWVENGATVSVEASYSFRVSGNRNLVAYFYNYVSGANHYVDLGLPSGLLWATCNVGAETPEGYGNYYAWGETQPKSTYNWSTYQYCNGSSNTLTKYCNRASYGYNGFTDNLTTLLPEDDAATANWGAEWRMPTHGEWQELFDNTTYIWAILNGVVGRLFTASNGNSLFLPVAGNRYGSSLISSGSVGYYWSSSLQYNPSDAWNYSFSYNSYSYNSNRSYGRSVRAVYPSTQNTAPTGAIDGKFTINEDGDQVYFSQGNLQYRASTNTWKFAENQYDYIGDANSNISSSYDGWIDLFGWGTSGYHDSNDPYNVNYQPWSSSDSELDNDYNTYGYGPSANMPDMNLTGTSANYDWGVNNPISNGGNAANQWRTLTLPEWSYVLNTRNTPSGIRFARAQVNNVNGVILLPDDWTTDAFNLNNTNSIGATYSSNVINASQWATIENVGGVFLPAAGGRFGTTVADVGSTGFYWLSSSYSSCCAYYVLLYNAGIYIVNYNRYLGRSVRLVSDVE